MDAYFLDCKRKNNSVPQLAHFSNSEKVRVDFLLPFSTPILLKEKVNRASKHETLLTRRGVIGWSTEYISPLIGILNGSYVR